MTEVKFYEEAADELLKFAVIIARSGDKWIFCKRRDRDTWEAPGGHREPGEKRAVRRDRGAGIYDQAGLRIFCDENGGARRRRVFWNAVLCGCKNI